MVHQSIQRIFGVLIAAALVQIYSVANHLLTHLPDERNNFEFKMESAITGTIGDHNNTNNGTTLLPRDNTSTNASQKNVKFVAFTDHSFAPVGQWWYQRMQNLGYTLRPSFSSNQRPWHTLTNLKKRENTIKWMYNSLMNLTQKGDLRFTVCGISVYSTV